MKDSYCVARARMRGLLSSYPICRTSQALTPTQHVWFITIKGENRALQDVQEDALPRTNEDV